MENNFASDSMWNVKDVTLKELKDTVVIDRCRYDELIRMSEKYNLQYDNLKKIIRNALEEEYKARIASMANEIRQRDAVIEKLNDRVSTYDKMYNNLVGAVNKYQKTGWWKRHFYKFERTKQATTSLVPPLSYTNLWRKPTGSWEVL